MNFKKVVLILLIIFILGSLGYGLIFNGIVWLMYNG